MKRLFLSLLLIGGLLVIGCSSPTKPGDDGNGSSGDFWVKTSLSVNKIRSLEMGSNDHIFVGTIGEEGSLFRSTDGGKNWETINDGLDEDQLVIFLEYNSDRNYIFAGFGYLFYSTDNGDSWVSTDANNKPVYLAASYAYDIYAGGLNGLVGGRIYSDYIDWGSALRDPVYALVAHPAENYFFAGTDDGVLRLYRGPGGQTWNQIGLAGEKVNSIVIGPQGEILAATENDVFYSSNGSSWQATGLNKKASSLAINGNGDVFAGTAYWGIFFSPNNGDWDWEETNSGLSSQKIKALIIDSRGYIYAGTNDQGLFKSAKSTE